MKSFLIIGMGRFGTYLSTKFTQLGNEVMIVDKIEKRIDTLAPIVATAQIGDCTQQEVLESMGVRNFDVCFVCIGENFQASLEITSLLKEMGAKYVVSKASREIQAKFLLRNGADEVVYPEKNMAEKIALKFNAEHVFDYIELTEEYCICEIPSPDAWAGKTIAQIDCRAKYKINILAIKNGDNKLILPDSDYVFNEGGHLMVLGLRTDVQKLAKRL